jgi:hypothetical protein
LPGIDALLLDLEGLELAGCILEFAVLDQLADQIPARVGFFLGFGLGLLVHRQQLAALDEHEGGGHDEELAGHIEIELTHHLDIFEELGGNLVRLIS